MATNSNTTTVDDPSGSEQYLTVSLGAEVYAIHLLGVKEIIEYGNVTHVPNLPGFIRGIINLRGRVVPVIDLASRFGQQSSPVSKFTSIVITEIADYAGARDVGLLVDSVRAVHAIPDTDIEALPSFGGGIRVDFIRGMWRTENRLAIILDVDRLLSAEEGDVVTANGRHEHAA